MKRNRIGGQEWWKRRRYSKRGGQGRYFNEDDVLAETQKSWLWKVFEDLRKSLLGDGTNTKILGQEWTWCVWKARRSRWLESGILGKKSGDWIRGEGKDPLREVAVVRNLGFSPKGESKLLMSTECWVGL